MPFPSDRAWRKAELILAVTALVSWSLAFWQMTPRLMAGPLCSSGQDIAVFAGHCPACPAAVLSTLALLTSLALRPRNRGLSRAG